MSNNMFCFQCEQTAGCSGCTGKMGVCGKSADIANLQDELTGALILFGLKGIAAYAYHAFVLGYSDEDVNSFFYEGLFAVGEDLNMERLLPTVMKVGEINLKCMALLDRANTESYGHPVPFNV